MTRTFLSNLALFHEVGSDELDRIAAGTTELRVKKGRTLFQRGDPCVGFHAVMYGQVKLSFLSPQGTEKVIEILGPGQSFGEAAMFLGRAYPVNAECLADSLLLHISKVTLDAELARDPLLARRMIAGLSRRLVGLVHDVEAYSLRSGMQRVIGYLLRDLDRKASTPTDAPVRIVLDTSKGVIASRLNLTPEHFSRILGELSNEGLISVRGAEITILDAERLRGFLI
ncbi:MAG: Crp/Fnr family transcriptional regulator [Burkholderiaceae bacterium]|nr:Crp/Fnr family transcriptional regulator [Burkholderiaceae bacterium]MEB2349970.1 Crp/Fnr family transcriptional regulator [Burkholderiaceae bacterium]